MPVLPPFRLESFFSRWEFAARYHLTASDAETMTVSELLAIAGPGAAEGLLDLRLGYVETYGSPGLRAAIAATYDRLAPEDILAFAGAEEGIYVAAQAILEAGDHTIVVTPCYQSAETVPLSIGPVTGVPLDADNGFTLDIDKVAAAVTPRTRLVMINFPHNPSGSILPRAGLDALIALCRRHGLWLFSDEVYRGIGLHPERQLPQVADLYERGMSLCVMSKAYGLPGLRVGWIACQDRAMLARMEGMKHYLSICNAGPSEYLARLALVNREAVLARTNAVLAENIGPLEDFFTEFADFFEFTRPDGGCVAYARWRGPGPVDDFCVRLVEEAGVLLLPAGLYVSELGPTPPDRFRVGYGRRGMAEALGAFRAFMRGNQRPWANAQ